MGICLGLKDRSKLNKFFKAEIIGAEENSSISKAHVIARAEFEHFEKKACLMGRRCHILIIPLLGRLK